MITFATAFIALYVGHHVGDYWVQTDYQAATKGKEDGWKACLSHVLSYLLTQSACLSIVQWVTGEAAAYWPSVLALAVSGLTHYTADRREFGLMFRLARLLPGKAAFLTLGAPRAGRDDNPSLGTGGWALDQSWHILLGCFAPALLIAGLS